MKGPTIGAVILGFIALIPALFFLGAFVLMLVYGAVASIYGFPTISFWDACIVQLALGIVGSYFRSLPSFSKKS